MSIGTIERGSNIATATILSGATTSNAIDLSRSAFVTLFVPSGYTSNGVVTFTASTSLGGTYLPLTGSDGEALTVTITAGEAIVLPEGVAGQAFVKLVIAEAAIATEAIIVGHKA